MRQVRKRKRMPLAEKIALGHFLSLTELSKARGISIKKLSTYKKEESNFPLFDGKVRLSDFDSWYRSLIQFAPLTEISAVSDKQPSYQSGVSPQRLDANKPRARLANYDLELALQSFR